MQIELNGEGYELEHDCSIATLLQQLELAGRIAVEVNREIVPRSEQASFMLNADDRVEIVRAIGGG